MNRRTLLSAIPAFLILSVGTAMADDKPITIDDLGNAFRKEPRFTRDMLQQSLLHSGLYDGGIDGAWGPGTEAAYQEILNSDVYLRHVPGWEWGRDVKIHETLFFLTSDAYM